MTIDAPQLTQVLNLLIAVGIFAGIAAGGLRWAMSFMLRGTERLIEPVKDTQDEIVAKQSSIASKVDANQREMVEKFDRLNSAVLGHESRLSFVEGKEAGRIEGWQQAQRGMELKPLSEKEREV